MKSSYIIGNWKSHKTSQEAKDWFRQLENVDLKIQNNQTIILCPPFTLLPICKELIQQYHLPFILGAQDVSAYPIGSYTGEIAAQQLKEFVEYVLIGHSERRKMGETDKMIQEKVQQSLSCGITPIVCLQGKDTPIPQGVEIVAYEPIFAIGTGHADTPEDAEDVLKHVKQKGITTAIYGGSVTGDNVVSFLEKPSIDGVLPGTDSLSADEFARIITHA